MSMRNIIQNEARPILQEWGYMLCTSSPGNYRFCKRNSEESITIDFCSARSFVRSFDVQYLIRKEKRYVLSFDFRDFPGGKCFVYSKDSTSKVDDYLRDVLGMTQREILPYIEAILRFHVPLHERLYRQLAQSTRQRAEQFFSKENISLVKSTDNFRCLDDAVKRIRPLKLESLQSSFLQNEEQILAIAAALGELMRIGAEQMYHWDWHNAGKSGNQEVLSDCTKSNHEYGLVSTLSGALYADPLALVLDVWNHADLQGRTLRRLAFLP